jgi:hypothetical protein
MLHVAVPALQRVYAFLASAQIAVVIFPKSVASGYKLAAKNCYGTRI